MNHIIDSLIRLSQILVDSIHNNPNKYSKNLQRAIQKAAVGNAWFTIENINYCINHWTSCLTQKNLEKWLTSYIIKKNKPKRIGIIMAGNIPLAGFHDFLCVLICGHHAHIKLPSQDKVIIPCYCKYIDRYKSIS